MRFIYYDNSAINADFIERICIERPNDLYEVYVVTPHSKTCVLATHKFAEAKKIANEILSKIGGSIL